MANENTKAKDNKANENQSKEELREIALKFGKGCVGDTFESKDGKQFTEIRIPNADPEDKRPWQTFVVPANHVHENKFGKGMWIKLPENGSTTVRRSVDMGKDDEGKTIWSKEENKVPNTELKKMVEFYKDKDRDKESLKDKLVSKTAEVAKKSKDQVKDMTKQRKPKQAAI